MKPNIATTLIVVLLLPCTLFAKDRVIVHPACEFTASGITHIEKIELTETETRLYVHEIFIPHWWVKFAKTTYIEDCATGRRLQATGIINGEFDKEIYMSASGDSTFILLFPPLDKSVAKINFCDTEDGDEATVYGISLKSGARPKTKKIPAKVSSWIDRQIAAAKQPPLMDVAAGEFFAHDTARLVGYIRGYDPRAGFSTGIAYAENDITNEDYPTVIQIHEDGRFEGNIPMNHPEYVTINFERTFINSYLEPGQTLAMILDWEEFRMADRLRNINYQFKDIRFLGAGAAINTELASFYASLPEIPLRQIYEKTNRQQPDEFKAFLNNLLADYTNTYNHLLDTRPLSERARAFLRNYYKVQYAMYLMEYEMVYKVSSRNREDRKLPPAFYDFLQDIPMDDQTLLSLPNFGMFINRLEFCRPFDAKYKAYNSLGQPEKTFSQYLFEELDLRKTAEDETYIALRDSFITLLDSPDTTTEEKELWVEKYSKVSEAFRDRHKQHFPDYEAKYIDVLKQATIEEISIEEQRIMDSVYLHVLKLKPGVIYDIIKVRSMNHVFSNNLKDDRWAAERFLTRTVAGIREPFLGMEARRLFQKNFPEEEHTARELPDTKEARIFKEIIDPFKGKYLLVDFWSTSCGPCISNIKSNKSLREEYKNSPDVAFIFITAENESPVNAYNRFVEEQQLEHTCRISADHYRYLRQLFRFNGVPRYVLVDRKGRILDDDLQGRFEEKLKELLLQESNLQPFAISIFTNQPTYINIK